MEEGFFQIMTIALMLVLVIYDLSIKTAINAKITESLFIYGFLFMMLIVIGLIIFDSIASFCSKIK